MAGAERVLEREPIEMMESGDYNTDVPILFGTTKQEGVLVLGGERTLLLVFYS